MAQAHLTTNVRVIARDTADRLGEGPLWSSREQALFWVDILGQRLNRLDVASGQINQWDMPEPVGWIIERRSGGFVAGLKSGIHAVSLEPFKLELLLSVEQDKPGNRLNDAKADSAGRVWFGTMPMSGDVPTGSFCRVETDLTLQSVDSGYCVANGPAISPDGRWMFHTDSHVGTVYRFPLNEAGQLGRREVFVQFQDDWGSPDGMTFDADGGLWIAHWGGSRVSRFMPDATIERSITLPASQITSCTFGGPNFDQMFITSAAHGLNEEQGGCLFAVDAGVRGLPACTFAG